VRRNLVAVTSTKRTFGDELLTVGALLRRGGVLEVLRKVGRRVRRVVLRRDR
jgi:hypothetical protein